MPQAKFPTGPGAVIRIIAAALLAQSASAQLPPGNWQFFWGDDFSGITVDTSKWLEGEPGWANSSQSLASPDGNLATVDGGELILTATRDAVGGGYDKSFRGGVISTYPYGSRGIQTPLFTAGTFFEARIRLPDTPGSWPAFWSLDPNAATGNELDIMEYPLNIAGGSGYANNEYHTAYHYNNYANAGAGKVTTGVNLGDGNYRTFAASWVGQELRFYLDGAQVRSFDNSAVNQMDDLYLMLNYAVGGNPDTWIGRPSTTEWPVGWSDETRVDWIRVWKLADAGTTSWTNAGGLSTDWQAWENNGSWSNGSPNLGGVTANFDTLGSLPERRIDVIQGGNGPRTLGVINLDGATRYRFGWPTDRLVLGFGNNGAIQPAINVAATTTTDHEFWIGLEWSGTLNLNNESSHDLLLTGPVRGGDGIVINGPGVVSFDGDDNRYSGTTTIDSGSQGPGVARVRGLNSLGSGLVVIGQQGNATTGRLELEDDATVPNEIHLPGRTNPSPGIVNNGGTNTIDGRVRVQVGGGNYWIQSDAGELVLAGNAPAADGLALDSIAGGTRTVTLKGAGDGRVQGRIENGSAATFNLVKADAGTWTLGGTNHYTGTTTVAGGSLVVDGSTGSGATSVESGATLAGGGTVGGGLTAKAGAIVRVGGTGFPLAPTFARPELLDDFSAYPTGATTTATGGLWNGEFVGTGNSNIISDGGNRVLETRGGAAWRGGKADLEENWNAGIGADETATIFFQMKAAGGGSYDVMTGLTPGVSNIDINNAWQDFAVMPFVAGTAGSSLAYRMTDAGLPGDVIFNMTAGTWYNVWLVVDNAAESYSVHWSTGTSDGNPGGTATIYRNGFTDTVLEAFGVMAAADASSSLLVDNLAFSPGVNTRHPLGPEPPMTPTAGTLEVSGDFTLSAGSTLELDVSSPTLHDRLVVDGLFTANGTLRVSLDAAQPAPANGDIFDLFDAGSASVNFAALDLPPLAAGLEWDTSAIADGGLAVVPDPSHYGGWALGQAFDPGDDDPALDLEPDGLANAFEWLLDGDPHAPDPGLLPAGTVMTPDGGEFPGADPGKRYLAMSAVVRKDITGMTLVPQAAASPGALDEPGSSSLVHSRVLEDLDDFERREWIYIVPIEDSPSGCMRLKLSAP